MLRRFTRADIEVITEALALLESEQNGVLDDIDQDVEAGFDGVSRGHGEQLARIHRIREVRRKVERA